MKISNFFTLIFYLWKRSSYRSDGTHHPIVGSALSIRFYLAVTLNDVNDTNERPLRNKFPEVISFCRAQHLVPEMRDYSE